VAGVLAAGAALGLAAERYTVGRVRNRPDPDAKEDFGELVGDEHVVTAADGVSLHVVETGDPDADLSMVLVHGYCLQAAAWHYQWQQLGDPRSGLRVIAYDARSHGRSDRSSKEHSTIEWLAHDLAAVLDQRVPAGPVVIAAHSMGGMTLMRLAGLHPELFGDRVVGAALIATSPGGMAEVTLGLPARIAKLARPLADRTLAQAGRLPRLVESGRRVSSDLAFLLTRRYAFGGPVSPSVVDFVERMIAATPVDVIAEFWPTFHDHDALDALEVFRNVETLALVGDSDFITPPDHTRRIVERVPGAELVVVPDAGHAVLLERPSLVTLHLRALCARVAAALDAA
jgi:pimeloyl-ACP methyl ester carboxylesterase